MSANNDDWRKAAKHRTHCTANAASVVVDAVARSEMDPDHSALDALHNRPREEQHSGGKFRR
jgi:hypothetical protein